jgi:hypothetical protein
MSAVGEGGLSLLLPRLMAVCQGMDITMIQPDNWHPFTSLQGVPAVNSLL